MKAASRLFFAAFLILLSVLLVSAQQKTRTIDERKNRHTDAPIEIVSREVGSVSFHDSKSPKVREAVADGNWIKDLTLSVKNVSHKNIVRFSILLTIPKQGAMTVDAGTLYNFPSVKAPTVKVLHPGEVIKITPWGAEAIMDYLKPRGVTDIQGVTLLIDSVVYDDHSGWNQGHATQEDRPSLETRYSYQINLWRAGP